MLHFIIVEWSRTGHQHPYPNLAALLPVLHENIGLGITAMPDMYQVGSSEFAGLLIERIMQRFPGVRCISFSTEEFPIIFS